MRQLQKQHIISQFFLIFGILLIFSLNSYAQRPAASFGGGGGGAGGGGLPGGLGGITRKVSGGGSTPKNTLKKSRLTNGTVVSVIPDSLRSTESDLDQTLEYSAEDSVMMDSENKVMYLYGKAQVLYGEIGLEADFIRVDWGKNEISAHGSTDTSGKHDAIGKPIFTENGTKYNTDSIRYNFNSKKAIIKGIVTQQGDGYLQGMKVKKDSLDNMYLENAKYTTCNLKEPHFHIGAKKIKLINKKQVISGPFRLYVADIPLPLVIPFGWFPIPKNKETGTSGFITPTAGEEPNGRGFYIRDGGYFFAISERFNFKVLGQVYSKGSWGLGGQSSYSKRYKYSGNLNLQFNSNKPGDRRPFDSRPTSRDLNLQWSHSPANLRPDRSFSTNVNFVTNDFNKNNSRDVNAYTQNSFGSSVQYSRSLSQNIKFNTSYRIDQNVRTKVMTTGLDLSFNVNQFNPFIPEKKFTGKKIEQLRVGFDFNGGLTTTNNITGSAFVTRDLGYKIKGTKRVNPDSVLLAERRNQEATYTKVLPLKTAEDFKRLINNGQFRGTFSVPIALPNFKLAKFINFTPGMSLQGNIYTKRYGYTYDAEDISVAVDTSKGAFFVPNVAFSASMNTRSYGTFYFKKGGRVQAIRHTLAPSISFSYTPSLAKNENYFQNVNVNPTRKMYLPRFDNLSAPDRYGAISFGLTNSLEAKIRSVADSSKEEFEKVSLLDNFSISGGYNILADTNRLSDISLSANTVLFKKFNISMGGSLNPYHYAKDIFNETNYSGLKTRFYRIQKGEGLAQLSNAFLTVGTNFRPKGKEKPKVATKGVSQEQVNFINKNPDLYVDFNIPWMLMVNYNFSYNKFGLSKSQIIQTLNMNGDFSLTPKWKVGFNTGWDFTYKELTLTTFTVSRELHCWDMNFSWTPKAAANSPRSGNYDITIRARGSIMQDLKLSRRRSFYDRGGF